MAQQPKCFCLNASYVCPRRAKVAAPGDAEAPAAALEIRDMLKVYKRNGTAFNAVDPLLG